ncbi:MAG TPA: hypothetical protein VHR47_08980 [Bacillota bacterium]|nr:hypothetical protein [Bacillota bacterium]
MSEKRTMRIKTVSQEKRTEDFAGKFQEQVKNGPKDAEGLFDVPGLNLVNPIASYATYDPVPVPRISNLADEAALEEDPSEKQ